MKNISVGLVTFKERRSLVAPLLKKIREIATDEVDIILAINGNFEESMPDDYRTEMLDLAKSYKNVYPIVCADFMSLSKLWNTLVLFSKTEYNFIMTDDLVIENPHVLTNVEEYIKSSGEEFFTINNGFSHFVLTKTFLHQIGYFDERLLAFGEEDGDLVHRYIKMFGKNVPSINIKGFYNGAAYHMKMQHAETHIDNKPRINREIIYIKYENDPQGICGMNPTPLSQTGILEDYQQYPYEMFVRNNRFNIKNFEKVILPND
jgi:hypothetical protein